MHKIAFMEIYKLFFTRNSNRRQHFCYYFILYIFVFVFDAPVISVYSAVLWTNYVFLFLLNTQPHIRFVSTSQTNYDIKRS